MLEEGNLPHPRCPWCDLQVPRKALNGRNMGTAQCKKGAERKRRRLAETEMRENLKRAFHAYGKPMEAVSEFRYLRRILKAMDDDWPVVAGNIRKARVCWGRLARVLGPPPPFPEPAPNVPSSPAPFGCSPPPPASHHPLP